MEYEWDENKRLSNIEKHGFDFIDADDLFDAPHRIARARNVAGEERWLAVGTIDGLPATLIFTRRIGAKGDETRRIISIRRSRHDE